MVKKTAQEYKKEMNDLLIQTERINQLVSDRLFTLCTHYPDAPIDNTKGQYNTIIKARSLSYSKSYMKDLSFDDRIIYISAIEKWIASQETFVQSEFEF